MRALAAILIAICVSAILAGTAGAVVRNVVPTADTSGPIVNITDPSGSVVRETVIAASGNATDVDTGINRVDLRLNGGSWLDAFGVTPGSSYVEWYRGALHPVNGPNRLEVRAWDVAGNPSAIASADFTASPWDLRIRVQAASRLFAPGELVNYSVDMTNFGNETAELWWSNTCVSYGTVQDENGTEWFNESQLPHSCGFAYSNITLAPGEAYSANGSWDQRDNTRNLVPSPGCYVLRRTFSGYTNLEEEPAIFGIGTSPFNTPPVADFQVASSTTEVQTPFTVDATGSFDCHDSPSSLEVRWDWQADGIWDTPWTSDKVAVHSYAAPGPQTIRLEVRDSDGALATAERNVTVRAAPDVSPPTVTHMPPAQGFAGENLTIWADVEDDGIVARVQLTYFEGDTARSLDMVAREPHVYAAHLIAPPSETSLRYHLLATDAVGHESRLPAVGEYRIPLVSLPSTVSPDLQSLGIGVGLGAAGGAIAATGVFWALRIRRKARPPSREP